MKSMIAEISPQDHSLRIFQLPGLEEGSGNSADYVYVHCIAQRLKSFSF